MDLFRFRDGVVVAVGAGKWALLAHREERRTHTRALTKGLAQVQGVLYRSGFVGRSHRDAPTWECSSPERCPTNRRRSRYSRALATVPSVSFRDPNISRAPIQVFFQQRCVHGLGNSVRSVRNGGLIRPSLSEWSFPSSETFGVHHHADFEPIDGGALPSLGGSSLSPLSTVGTSTPFQQLGAGRVSTRASRGLAGQQLNPDAIGRFGGHFEVVSDYRFLSPSEAPRARPTGTKERGWSSPKGRLTALVAIGVRLGNVV
jgi:hypothetical protein